VRGGRGRLRSRRRLEHLGREKPKGATSGRRANHLPIARDSGAGQNPEAAACRAGPPHPCGEFTDGKNGRWARSGGNAPITASKENAPKGKSHERCRRETKPARVRRAKAAQRVAKPCTRTVAGLERPRSVDRRILHVLKGTEVHESCPRAAARGPGFAGQGSEGKANSKRGIAGLLNCGPVRPTRETHTAGANGPTAQRASPNQ